MKLRKHLKMCIIAVSAVLLGTASSNYEGPKPIGSAGKTDQPAEGGAQFFSLHFKERNLALDAELVYSGGDYTADEGWITEKGKYFSTKRVKNWIANSAGIELRWKDAVSLNAVMLKERTEAKDASTNQSMPPEYSDSVLLFRIYALSDAGTWEIVYEGDRIGTETICYIEERKTSALRVEFSDLSGPMQLESLGVYCLEKKANPQFKVSQYLRMDNYDIADRLDDPGFSGYYDAVTDVIIFDAVYLDSAGGVLFYNDPVNGEERFAVNFNALKKIIGARPVRIWATVFFDQFKTSSDGGRYKDLDETAEMLIKNRETVNANIKAFAEKYGLYGIDYDWEFPNSDRHWTAYNQILSDTAEFAKVSVAISPWGFRASPEIIAKIEHFNVMAYDIFDYRGYHSTMMTGAYEPIDVLLKTGVFPKEKLLLGVPTYGRATNRSGNAWPEYGKTVTKTADGYTGVLGKWTNRIQQFDYIEDGMEKSCTAYLNGYGIIRDKTLFALESGIGGMMIFRAKCDAPYDYQYSLHRGIKEVLDAMTVKSASDAREPFSLNIAEPNRALDADITYTGDAYTAEDDWIAAEGKYFIRRGQRGSSGFELHWKADTPINAVLLKERGDNVVLFRLYSLNSEGWELVYEQDRIARENIGYLGELNTRALRFEITESTGNVELETIGVYHINKSPPEKPFKVSQYLRMDNYDIADRLNDPGFSGYYDVVTDVIIFDAVYLNSDGKPVFYGDTVSGEARFAANFDALKKIIGARPVRIWATVFFDQYDLTPDGGRRKNMDKSAELLFNKRDAVNAELRAFVQKYGLYGIDYDWEYPWSETQWNAYNQILCDTAEFAKVSVAIAPWRFDAAPETIEKIEHFNVMAYDLFDERGYHSTMVSGGYDALDSLLNRLKFPKEKLLLGIPTYGRATNRSENAWPQYSGTVTKTDNGYTGSLGKWTNRLMEFTYREDGVEKNCAGYLNGYALVRDKTLLSLLSGIGGVMIFRAKCDAPYDYQYSLHRGIKEVLDSLK
ncbi:MAG: hypothetical protein LBG87_05105 [Spirochaetaceae bacterium]|nr:hypothetical protein [Spirochaetaceae bacterium]